MKIEFDQQGLYEFYVEGEENPALYNRFELYFENAEEWQMEGTYAKIDEAINTLIWFPQKGDHLLQRYLSDSFARVIK